MSEETKYFNFPIELLSGYLEDKRPVLRQILYYSLYEHSLKLEHGDEEEKIEASAEFLGVEISSAKYILSEGEVLFNSLNGVGPKVGLNTSIYWDYRNNYKTEFEEVCLLAFLALKSIIQNKAYCKVTNLYWLSRMDGNAKTVAAEFELSEGLRKYAKEYQLKKIKSELIDNWGLVHYAKRTRGFYVSFKIELEELAFHVLKNKQTRSEKLKEQKRKQDLATQKAMERIKNITNK